MKIAYLILAHGNERHLARLVDALRDDLARTFVHIDKKSDLRRFSTLRRKGVSFCSQRVPVFWGEFTVVEATLRLIEAALEYRGLRFDYFVLLSGADYPITSLANIRDYLAARRGKLFMNSIAMPNVRAGKPLSRLIKYHPQSDRPWEAVLWRLAQRALPTSALERDYRRHLKGMQPCAGSAWWTLPREAVLYVLEFCQTQPKIVRFLRNTYCPDELFFQTLLCNSPLNHEIVPNLTFADWSAGGGSPATLTAAHVQALITPGTPIKNASFFGERDYLFARKFPDDSEALVAMLDAKRS